MNSIKSLFVALFIAASVAVSAQNTITANEAVITINGQTTREQLVQLRTDLVAQGFDFKYVPKFDSQRHITGISFTVTANNGQLTGTGEHTDLQHTNASITFHVNKTAGTFTVDSH